MNNNKRISYVTVALEVILVVFLLQGNPGPPGLPGSRGKTGPIGMKVNVIEPTSLIAT